MNRWDVVDVVVVSVVASLVVVDVAVAVVVVIVVVDPRNPPFMFGEDQVGNS